MTQHPSFSCGSGVQLKTYLHLPRASHHPDTRQRMLMSLPWAVTFFFTNLVAQPHACQALHVARRFQPHLHAFLHATIARISYLRDCSYEINATFPG